MNSYDYWIYQFIYSTNWEYMRSLHAWLVCIRVYEFIHLDVNMNLWFCQMSVLGRKCIKCGHACRFGSPSAGSGPRLYCTSACPFAAAGHDPGPDCRHLHVGGMRGGSGCRACWQDTFWLGRWSLSLQPPALPLSLSRPSCTCVLVRPPDTGSGPTRPASYVVAGCRNSDNSPFSRAYICGSPDLYTLLALHRGKYTSTDLATSHPASSFQRCDSSCSRPSFRSRPRHPSLLSRSFESGLTRKIIRWVAMSESPVRRPRLAWVAVARSVRAALRTATARELTGISPRSDKNFPTATLKRYFKGCGLGLRAEILG